MHVKKGSEVLFVDDGTLDYWRGKGYEPFESGDIVVAPAFTPNTPYTAAQLVWNAGALYRAKADFTSAGSFSAGNWDPVGSATSVPDPSSAPNGKIVTVSDGHYVLEDGGGGGGSAPVPPTDFLAVYRDQTGLVLTGGGDGTPVVFDDLGGHTGTSITAPTLPTDAFTIVESGVYWIRVEADYDSTDLTGNNCAFLQIQTTSASFPDGNGNINLPDTPLNTFHSRLCGETRVPLPAGAQVSLAIFYGDDTAHSLTFSYIELDIIRVG
ncbi:MAG: hypothetical protein JO222_09310 [Frankiales bacterium]|nr:hypothetical protein [Frankiales bacterium]